MKPNPIAKFLDKIRSAGLDEDDDAVKSIKQLGLLSLLPCLDRDIMKDATVKLMDKIVSGKRQTTSPEPEGDSYCSFRRDSGTKSMEPNRRVAIMHSFTSRTDVRR